MSGIANHLRLCASQLIEAADMIERQAEELEYRKHLNKRLAAMVDAQSLSAGDRNIVEQGLGLRAGGGAASQVSPDDAVRCPPLARSIEVVEREMTDEEVAEFGRRARGGG